MEKEEGTCDRMRRKELGKEGNGEVTNISVAKGIKLENT